MIYVYRDKDRVRDAFPSRLAFYLGKDSIPVPEYCHPSPFNSD